MTMIWKSHEIVDRVIGYYDHIYIYIEQDVKAERSF